MRRLMIVLLAFALMGIVTPAANAISAKMNAAVGLTPEKNCAEMIAASDP